MKLRNVFGTTNFILILSAMCFAALQTRGADLPEGARDAWLKYEERLPCLRGTAKVETTRLSGKGPATTSAVTRTVKLSKSAALLELHSTTQLVGTKVFGTNPKYAFAISRQAEQNDYLLDSFSEDPAVVFQQKLPGPIRQEVLKLLSTPYQAADFPYTLLLDSREYQFTDVTPSQEFKDVLRVSYRRQPTATTSGHADSGWFDLDPTHGWSILGGQFTRQEGKQAITYQFRSYAVMNNQGIPIPRERKTWASMTRPNGEVSTVEIQIVYDLTATDTIPEEEFTLSAYGLPEPFGVVWKKETPRYVWFVIAAALSGVIAIVCRWLSIRRRPRPV